MDELRLIQVRYLPPPGEKLHVVFSDPNGSVQTDYTLLLCDALRPESGREERALPFRVNSNVQERSCEFALRGPLRHNALYRFRIRDARGETSNSVDCYTGIKSEVRYAVKRESQRISVTVRPSAAMDGSCLVLLYSDRTGVYPFPFGDLAAGTNYTAFVPSVPPGIDLTVAVDGPNKEKYVLRREA